MNRSASLLFAFGVLVAHALVLFQDALGHLARPTDEVHVAFHMARNLVREHSAAFNLGQPLLESYPSHAWVLLAALAERLYIGPNLLAQGTGLVSTLALVWVVSRFSPARLAGVMAPFLVVVSGSVATAALSGTEWPTFALLCAASLLMLEEGRPRALAACASLAILVRPEGILLVAALGALALASRSRHRSADEPRPGQARVKAFAFAVPFVVWLAIGGLRVAFTGHFLPPVIADAIDPDPRKWAAGSQQLIDFFARSGAMLLVVVPVAFGLVGRLSPRGRRALVVGLAWCLYVAWQGGNGLPMWQALVPAIPFLAVAIQEALTDLVDVDSGLVQRAAWTLFLLGLGASLLVSRRPSDIGPFPLESLQKAWMDAPEVERLFGNQAGRPGLAQRLAEDERRRCAAIFVRENLETNAVVATLWPGAVAYLSGRTIVDLTGRATPHVGQRLHGDFGPALVDLIQALGSEPDFLLPPIALDRIDGEVEEIARLWLDRYDLYGADDPRRVARLVEILGHYELVAVPIPVHSSLPNTASPEPYGILRHDRFGPQTELQINVRDGQLVVSARHTGHRQIVDLVVERVAADGSVMHLLPNGSFIDQGPAHARSHLLLHASGRRWIRLIEAPFPAWPPLDQLRARLVAPGATALAEGDEGHTARVEALWPRAGSDWPRGGDDDE
ncbi:hypothetical protein Pla163_34290 [Planctomycetes bacterium Pla163]|uniref:Glycosyltransferase RgtA/B/C/D-like domain-containing protein n=1 Tax=Rohdeia mirabilis TaxID=2528008 RepID=A0A518D477_9BACT|nr:hypothetical protein Pla163_34290 [Planctomycetes bacterium Pla163]